MPLTPDQKKELEAQMQEYVGKPISEPTPGRDVVNEPMIRQWCDAMGDTNPAYLDPDAAKSSVHGDLVAPPTMLQAWTMEGFSMHEGYDEPRNNEHRLHKLLTEHGYTSVVATNTEQGYTRYLKPGDTVTAETFIDEISEEKATALGIGYFINTRTKFTDQDGEEVGWLTFRVLKFIPQQQPQQADASDTPASSAPARIAAPRGHDNSAWWAEVDAGKIPIQTCNQCGELFHPPRPMCGKCGAMDMGYVTSSGKGTIHTFTVIHHPQFPGYDFPILAVLVDLEEGTRLMSNMVDCKPEDLHVGMAVQGSVEEGEDGMKLPVFRRAG
ncbi:MAG: hypothetical protein CL910_19095 [Deltaproteobacteria bacterium]|jgi:uncharacterized OB-fold protein/acyl dehydratase|nr:hypothetical protein [Deltaproteobacteria bacterium]